MAITPEALDAFFCDFEAYLKVAKEVMDKRTTWLPTVSTVIADKTSIALHEVNESRKDLALKKAKSVTRNRFAIAVKEAQSQYNIAKTQHDFLWSIYNKFTRIKQLIQNLDSDDQIRFQEIQDLEKTITKEWSELNQKQIDKIDFDDADEVKFQNLRKKLIQLGRLKEEILRHQDKIVHCHQFAEQYDSNHLKNMYDRIEYANVIFEEKDQYGFVGKIVHQDVPDHRSEPSGLTAYCQTRGEMLAAHEVVRYTHPDFPKVVIEQDSHGRITNKTDPNAQEGSVQSALKMADLLLMDMKKQGKHTVSIQANPAHKNRAVLLIAAVLYEAQVAGISLSIENIKVDIPGWELDKEKAQIENCKQGFPNYHQHYKTETALKEKIQYIRNGGDDALNLEPLITPKKGS